MIEKDLENRLCNQSLSDSNNKFKLGDTVVFDENSFDEKFWGKLSEDDKIKYYGSLGYGQDKPKLFTFICEMNPQVGHCILIDANGQIETMRHISDFRLAEEEEC